MFINLWRTTLLRGDEVLVVSKFEGCLGIDESFYHPEKKRVKYQIIVGVYSTLDGDGDHLEEHEKNLSKIRRGITGKNRVYDETKTDDAFKWLLEERDFRHFVIPEKFNTLWKPNTRLLLFADLIDYYGDVEKVIIDGQPKSTSTEDLEQIISSNTIPKIIRDANADRHYPIVNAADLIAYILRQYYKSHDFKLQEATKYERYLLLLKKKGTGYYQERLNKLKNPQKKRKR